MSTLVLAMALWTAAGNAPASVSAEMERPLDLPGTWEGTLARGGVIWRFESPHRSVKEKLVLAVSTEGWLLLDEDWTLFDEGHGRFRVIKGGETYLGIYRWEGSRFVLCVGWSEDIRPTSFQDTGGQILFHLRRVR